MTKLSFIVIGYNIEQYIGRCLSSILSQSLENFEIIFVDDGSTDNTLAIVQKYSKDKKVNIVTQNNLGANAARKAGFKKAKGKYVVFIDGDDWIEENFAKDMDLFIDKNIYDIICYESYLAYDEYSKFNKLNNINNEELNEYEYLEEILEQKISHVFWNKMFKREFLLCARFEEIIGLTMGDDLAANIKLGINKPKTYFMDKPYYYYYQRESGVTKKISEKTLEIIECLNYIENLLIENNLVDKYKQQLDFLWFLHCFFMRIVINWREDTKIQKILYDTWKNKNIDIKDNLVYIEFINNKRLFIRMISWILNNNYVLGHYIIYPIKRTESVIKSFVS